MQSSEVQGLGQLLQQARERKGVTLTEAQQATKIRYSFLQAIENEDFTVLPPKVYARGFIKIYATYLELDPVLIVQRYDELADGYLLYPVQAVPSADSGGQNIPPALRGLTQGEMRTIEPSDSRFQTTLIAPVGTPPENNGPIPETRAIVPVFQRRPETALVHNPQQIVLPRVMLADTKGAFYIPNFAPVLFVAVIILAASLLLYRGITSQNSDPQNPALGVVSATQTTGLTNNARTTPTAVATTLTPMTPPPNQSINAAQNASTNPGQQPPPAPTRAIGQGGVAITTAPPADTTQPPAPTATPVPSNVKVEVVVGTSDSRGSWLTVWVDDQQVLARIAAPGEHLNYEGKKVAVRAGNPGIITLKVNGADREYTKPGTGVITRTIFNDGRPDTVEN